MEGSVFKPPMRFLAQPLQVLDEQQKLGNVPGFAHIICVSAEENPSALMPSHTLRHGFSLGCILESTEEIILNPHALVPPGEILICLECILGMGICKSSPGTLNVQQHENHALCNTPTWPHAGDTHHCFTVAQHLQWS